MMQPPLRFVFAALFISLGLNLFMGSFILAGVKAYSNPEAAMRKRLLAALYELPPEQRARAEAAVAGIYAQDLPVVDQLRTERKKFAYLLISMPTDKRIVFAQAARIRMLTGQLQGGIQEAAIELAGRLPKDRKEEFFKDSALLDAVIQ